MKIYLVGGAVRDQLLGLAVSERDWVVVGATPEEMLALDFRQVGRDFPVYLHPDNNEEYALARTERKTGTGHTAFSCNSDPSVTLEEDLSRRDLTINAMAESGDGELIDPYGGRRDLEQKLLRHVSDAFIEDPLRVLRVARFAARFHHLGFTIAAETLALMRQLAESGELRSLPPERIWSELERAMATPSPRIFFSTLDDCGALEELMPALAANPDALALLERAAAHSTDALLRFGAALSALPVEACDQLFEQVRPPRRYRELALNCARFGEHYRAAAQGDGEHLLALLEGLDAFRRPERLQQYLDACELVHPEYPASRRRIEQALAVCGAVDPGQWAKAGLKGPEIARRLREERLRLLAELDSG